MRVESVDDMIREREREGWTHGTRHDTTRHDTTRQMARGWTLLSLSPCVGSVRTVGC